ncbi:MAG: proteasome accessory factor PafA2 family protein, partial [Planctomycetes bacterium]|nr:proteasome accessory factor PafA2 family protein [Planctomycetota bacterium]
MAPSLFGLELELGLAAQGPRGEALPPSLAAGELLRLAAARLAHLPDAFSKGIFSTSSIRIYGDTGSHPEVCTPECTDPWDAVRYTRAGERIVAALAARLPEACAAIARAFAFRTNVDYSGAKTSWGAHESYLHRSSPAALQRQVIPFLASRVVLCGAGGFDATQPGAVFTLSPRAPYIEHVASDSSTHDRGLYHTKDEPLARRGWHRLHVIAGESLGSDTALWLKVSTTALVVALAEAG